MAPFELPPNHELLSTSQHQPQPSARSPQDLTATLQAADVMRAAQESAIQAQQAAQKVARASMEAESQSEQIVSLSCDDQNKADKVES